MAIAENENLQGNSKQARTIAQELYRTTKDLEYNDIGISLLTIISKSYLNENNLDLASDYANKIFERKPNLETKINIFRLLSDINFRKEKYALALNYRDSIIKTESELNEIKNGKVFENSRVKFEIENYKKEIANNESKIAEERKLFIPSLPLYLLL